jgi:hypothetical protein
MIWEHTSGEDDLYCSSYLSKIWHDLLWFRIPLKKLWCTGKCLRKIVLVVATYGIIYGSTCFLSGCHLIIIVLKTPLVSN